MNKKYKGVCEITLSDEKGQVVQKTRDENMVTNAVTNLFKFSAADMALNIANNNSTYLDSLYTNYKNFYGGVLLFDDTITEDPDVVYPPANITNLGHAGGTYAGGNTYRGSLNVTESQAVENGYKFVWDFPTSACIGTIKSVCLTSIWGGNVGYDNSQQDSDASFLIPFAYRYFGSYTTNFRPIKKLSDTELLGVSLSGTTINFVKATYFNSPSLSNANNIVKYTTIASYTSTGSLCELRKLFITPTYVLSAVSKSTSSIHLVKVGFDGVVEYDKTISQSVAFPSYYTIYSFGLLNNDLICVISSDAFYKVNTISGETESLDFSLNGSTNMGCWYLNGRLVWGNSQGGSSYRLGCSYNGTFHKFGMGETYNGETREIVSLPIDLATPILLYNSGNNPNFSTTFNLFAPYLATIDNLSAPVTKTASLSMKVTYTITEVSETTDDTSE